MEAFQLAPAVRGHSYACRSLSVTPNPPQVGVPTLIGLSLKNGGPEPITVSRIAFKVSQFGIGAHWEELPPIGPLHLPADPNHIEEIKQEWTPTSGGHRCVRGSIDVENVPQAVWLGINLNIIESPAEQRAWQVPFRLGNPENERQPIVLQVGASDQAQVEAHLIVGNRPVRAGEPVWLNAREEVEARLLLLARQPGALESVHTIEGTINGRLIDGIQVVVRRPAAISVYEAPTPAFVMSKEPAFARAS